MKTNPNKCDYCGHFRKTIPTYISDKDKEHIMKEFRLCAECRKIVLNKESK
jgi:hypothetical protein